MRQRGKPKQKQDIPIRGIFERPKGSGCWWIVYHDELGKRHREKVGMKQAAISAYQQRKTEIRQGKFIPEEVRRKKVSVTQVVDDYQAACEARKVKDISCIKARLAWWKSHFSGKAAKGITASDMEAARKVLSNMKPWANGWTRKADGLATATINKYFATLKAAFFLAVRNEKVDRNPVSLVRMLKENNARTRYLSDDEEQRLFEVLPDEYHDMVLLALNTGMRRMELLSLQWADLNFPQRIIMIRQSKSGESRTIPMNDIVYATFKGIVRRLDSLYVFPGTLPGTHRTDLPKSWEKFLQQAGIKDFKWHDLRHTFGSRLAMAGVDLYTISKLMGHKTIAMTQRYAHLSQGHLQEAVNLLAKKTTATKTATRG